ncbi:MAG: hypothetical protein KDE15_08165 [Erythrobacter sp.]|nr:hypothetical protein [Erythrobacter sp.]
MNVLTASREGPLRLLQSLLILGLAGLLIFYHIVMLRDYAMGQALSSDATYNAVQAALRRCIIASLTGVILGKRVALIAMWISIPSLIATHYWAHYGNVPVDFTEGRHPLSYLKGLIIPSIITGAFLYRRRQD